jgi:hypothetical protein
MNPFKKYINKQLSKGLTVYTNKTRIISFKYKSAFTKFSNGFKDVLYDFLLYLEKKESKFLKLFFIAYVCNYYPCKWITELWNGDTTDINAPKTTREFLNKYQTEDIQQDLNDQHNSLRIRYSIVIDYY